jgi:hypothetical protein
MFLGGTKIRFYVYFNSKLIIYLLFFKCLYFYYPYIMVNDKHQNYKKNKKIGKV